MTHEEIDQLYRKNYEAMYRLARTMLYDEEESRDVVSEVFERVMRDAVPTPSYLLTAVRHRCLDRIAHKQVRERVERLLTAERAQDAVTVEDDDDRLERLMLFIDEQLPPLSRRIFHLRFIEEMTYEEVATAVGVGRSTVFNHLTQAIARIHQYFKLNR